MKADIDFGFRNVYLVNSVNFKNTETLLKQLRARSLSATPADLKFDKLVLELKEPRIDKIEKFLNQNFYSKEIKKCESSVDLLNSGWTTGSFGDAIEEIFQPEDYQFWAFMIGLKRQKRVFFLVQSKKIFVFSESSGFLFRFLQAFSNSLILSVYSEYD